MTSSNGFSLLELLVAMALTLAVAAGVLMLVGTAPDAFAVQSETSDLHQRLRVAASTLAADLMAAQAVYPYRSHGPAADPPGSFKTDVITVVNQEAATTYWLQEDRDEQVYRLAAYSGGADVPVVDDVVGLTFEYWGDPEPPRMLKAAGDPFGPWTTYGPAPSAVAVPPYAPGENCVFVTDPSGATVSRLPSLALPGTALVPLAAPQLSDGPWCPDATAIERWDADLLRVRAVLITIRVQAAAAALRGPAGVLFAHAGTSENPRHMVPDIELQQRVAPRNLNHAR